MPGQEIECQEKVYMWQAVSSQNDTHVVIVDLFEEKATSSVTWPKVGFAWTEDTISVLSGGVTAAAMVMEPIG
jgi:hypothetical protein